MNHKIVNVLLFFLLMFSGFAGILITIPSNVTAYTSHDPISINGDADFAEQAANEGWRGDGSEGNPYIIEGYDINATYGYEIQIESTTVHFTIENSVFRESGVTLYNITNGTITNCLIGENNLYSMNLNIYSSTHISIIDNRIHGLWGGINLWDSSNLIIEGNRLQDCGITISGYDFEHWASHDISPSNTVNNKTVYYWKNKIGGTLPKDAGQVILANCTNVVVENENLVNVSTGIQMAFSSSNAIRDNRVSENDDLFNYGIYLINSSNNKIYNNSIKNKYHGIYLDGNSSYNNITRNDVSESEIGISLNRNSYNNVIGNNSLFNNTEGISLLYSYNGSVSNNILVNNGIMIDGNEVEHWTTHDIDTSNKVNGWPVYYYKNEGGGTNPSNAGQVILANCTGMRIENLNIKDTSSGLLIGFSHNNTITNNTFNFNDIGININRESNNNVITFNRAYNNDIGMYIYSAEENQVISNSFTSNIWDGLRLSSASNNFIMNNTAHDNRDGIELSSSTGNIVIDNSATSNEWSGIHIGRSNRNHLSNNTVSFNYDVGIGIYSSQENEIISNKVSRNKWGIFSTHSHTNFITSNEISDNVWGIDLDDCNGTIIERNTISSNNNRGLHIQESNGSYISFNNISFNNEGISLRYCRNNTFHHNYLYNNERQVWLSDSNNTWHDGQGEGNYWSDYEGMDTNGDGVGDTLLPHQEVDYHPLTEPNVVEKQEDKSDYGLWLFSTVIVVAILIFMILTSARLMKKQRRKNGENEKPDLDDRKPSEEPIPPPQNLDEKQ